MKPEGEAQKPSLSKNQLRKLRASQRKEERERQQTLVSRREFITRASLIGLGAAGALGAAGFVAWQIGARTERKQPPPTPTVPPDLDTLRRQYQDREKRLEEVLGKTDKATDYLQKELEGKLQAYSAGDRIALVVPLDVYRINRANPFRNKYKLLLKDLAERGQQALTTEGGIRIDDLAYFSAGLLEGKANLAAGFEPATRSINLGEGFSPDNLLDILILYHELEHAHQDTLVRSSLDTREKANIYYNFYTIAPRQRQRIVGAFEQEAYLKEAMVLDALTDGQLKKDVTSGRVDVDQYMQRLKARPDQRELLEVVLNGAKVAFTSGTTLTAFSREYADFINQNYRNIGYDIYALNNNRFERIP